VLLALAACGGDGNGGGAPDAPPAGNPDAAASADAAAADAGAGASDASGPDAGESPDAGGDTAIDDALLEEALPVHELQLALADRIGDRVWVHGHHSLVRLDGALPPVDWEESEVLVFGEVKDFAAATGLPAVAPTALVTVIRFHRLNTAVDPGTWENLLLPGAPPSPARLPAPPPAAKSPAERPAIRPGNRAEPCDRSVILSGGVDASNNHARYRDNVVAKVAKMKELGFADDQIEVVYNDGAAIEVGGANVVDRGAGKQGILDHFAELAEDMEGSCTLTIFVTDHGTGYSAEQGYHGARPALSGPEATAAGGVRVAENTFKMDARAKVFRTSDQFFLAGQAWLVTEDSSGNVFLYKRAGGAWAFAGRDTNGNGTISEQEASSDLNGDGDPDDPVGLRVQALRALLTQFLHYDNAWDTDADGEPDVRLRWDGARYVAERKVGDAWREMGRDSNGDHVIDGADGGVDWNLDGDRSDQVGFHEGINLWGSEILWDDELAALLKPLDDAGVHILVEMVSCFGGGFVPNLEGLVENVVAGSSEDTKHTNRRRADGVIFAADELAFLDHLAGIDPASWSAAWDAAIAADDALAPPGRENHHTRWETPRIETASVFEADGGQYTLQLRLPEDLVGEIFDFEIILGLQEPRWLFAAFPGGLPDGLMSEVIPGGIRVFGDSPLPDGLIVDLTGTPGSERLRIGLTDEDHVSLGYTMAQPGTVVRPRVVFVDQLTGLYRHFQGYSEVYGAVRVVDEDGAPIQGAVVLVQMGMQQSLVPTDADGFADYVFMITQYGTYVVEVASMVTPEGTVYDPERNVTSSVEVVVVP
jgi:hypothetical protein